MSLRNTVLRAARPVVARTAQGPVIGRRAASSGHHAPSSNMPWALGSAAVFGSLAAFILMPAGEHAAQTVHDSVDAKGQGGHVDAPGERPEDQTEHHENARDLMRKERDSGERPTRDEDPKGKMVHAGENRSRTEIPSKRDDEKPMRRGPSTGSDFQANDGKIDPEHMQAGVANKGSNASDSSSSSEKANELKDQAKDKASDLKDQAKDKYSELKSQASDKYSELKSQAADKYADLKGQAQGKAGELKEKAEGAVDGAKEKAEEVKGQAKEKAEELKGQAKEKADEVTEGSPSKKDIVDSIHQAENVAVPRAAMAEDRK